MKGPPPERTDVHRDPAAEDPTCERTLAWEIRPVVRGGDGISRLTCVTRLPATYVYFLGHFPAYPVLAAAVQLHELVLPCLRRSRPDLGSLRRLKDLKFHERIGPGERLEVTLAWKEDAAQIAFEILADGVRASVGTVVLHRAGDAGPA